MSTHTHKDSTKELFNFYAIEYTLIRKLTKTKVCLVCENRSLKNFARQRQMRADSRGGAATYEWTPAGSTVAH